MLDRLHTAGFPKEARRANTKEPRLVSTDDADTEVQDTGVRDTEARDRVVDITARRKAFIQ